MDRLAGLPIPSEALEAARDAFPEGLNRCVRIAAVATALGAVAALVLLPGRGVDPNTAEREDAGVPA